MPQSVMRIWLFSAKPSLVHASMDVAGATVLRSTSRAPKSVCVSSSDLGPRSRVLGGLDWRWLAGVVWSQRGGGLTICRDGAVNEYAGAMGR